MTQDLKKAAAIRYDEEWAHIPKVAAVGKGLTAENIIEKAKEHQIPIVEDPSLVELLAQLQINELIPEQLYDAVAEVFTFIYHTDQSVSASKGENT